MCDFYALRLSAVRQRVLPRVTSGVLVVFFCRCHQGTFWGRSAAAPCGAFLLGFTGLHPVIADRVCPFRPISGRTTRCIFSWVLLGFTLPSRVGCVQRSQRRLRARSHRPQHRPQKGGWLRECTGRDSFCQRCDRTCEIHLGANRQELMYFSVAIVVVLIFRF